MGTKAYQLRMIFEVGGISLRDHSIMQVWVSFEDQQDPGKYLSFTCSAKYSTYSLYAGHISVQSYYGNSQFTMD